MRQGNTHLKGLGPSAFCLPHEPTPNPAPPPPSNLVLPCVPCCGIAIQLHLDGPILCHGNVYRFLKKTHAQRKCERRCTGPQTPQISRKHCTAAPKRNKGNRGGACFAPKFNEHRRRLEDKLTTCLPTYPSFTIALACTGACARSRSQLIRRQAVTGTDFCQVQLA